MTVMIWPWWPSSWVELVRRALAEREAGSDAHVCHARDGDESVEVYVVVVEGRVCSPPLF